MVNLTEEMKAQLMKVTGIADVSEFDSLVEKHAPQIGNFDESLNKHSPFDLQMILLREQIENQGIEGFTRKSTEEDKLQHVYEVKK